MPAITLDTGDAAERAELLQFIRDWLATDHNHIDTSLNRFAGQTHQIQRFLLSSLPATRAIQRCASRRSLDTKS